jgi:hypothetical protein
MAEMAAVIRAVYGRHIFSFSVSQEARKYAVFLFDESIKIKDSPQKRRDAEKSTLLKKRFLCASASPR